MDNPENQNEKTLEEKLLELKPIYCELEVKDTVRDILYVVGLDGDELDIHVDMFIKELNHRRERKVY